MAILVLTNKWDPHSDSVIEQIEHLGAEVVRINTEDIGQNKLSWQLAVDVPLITTPENRVVSTNNIRVVYLRRTPKVAVANLDSKYEKFVQYEFSVFTESLETTLPDVTWFDHPIHRSYADNKIRQLTKAKQVNLVVPPTLVTNDFEQIKKFISLGKVVYKTLYAPVIDYGQQGTSVVHTTLLDPKRLMEYGELISSCPGIFQSFVEKAYDLRIHFINGHIIPIKIDSQKFEESIIDWRKANFRKLNYEIVEIPQDIKTKISIFMQELNLRLGIFDFAVTANGEYVFLELNPDGNWLWIDSFINYQISQKIAEQLVSSHERERR